MRILKNEPRRAEGASVAQVSFSDAAGFGAVGATEYRDIPVFAPRGIAYRPCEGDNLLVLPVDGVDMCIGVLAPAPECLEGEVRISSAGGASILLKNTGEVVINGLTITKQGEVIGG